MTKFDIRPSSFRQASDIRNTSQCPGTTAWDARIHLKTLKVIIFIFLKGRNLGHISKVRKSRYILAFFEQIESEMRVVCRSYVSRQRNERKFNNSKKAQIKKKYIFLNKELQFDIQSRMTFVKLCLIGVFGDKF